MPAYHPPDFEPLARAPEARFAPAPREGVAPEGFFVSSSHPTYVKVAGRWVMPERPLGSCVIVRRGERLVTLEARQLRQGDHVALGEREDGSEGILVHATGFAPAGHGPAELAPRLNEERQRDGYLVWVLGPSVRRSADLEWFVEQGYVQAVLTGNAVAAHDLAAALHDDEARHLRAINRVRELGGISGAVDAGAVKGGLLHALVTRHLPFVLTGSIDDDGPLPEVITDALAARDAMREHTARATGAVLIDTPAGNLLPAFHTHRGEVEPMLTLSIGTGTLHALRQHLAQ